MNAPGKATFVFTDPAKKTPEFDTTSLFVMPELPDFIRPGYPAILISGKAGEFQRSRSLIVDPIRYERDKPELAVDHFAVWAMLVEGAPTDRTAKRHIFMIGGKVKFESFDRQPGGKIKGSFDLRVPLFGK